MANEPEFKKPDRDPEVCTIPPSDPEIDNRRDPRSGWIAIENLPQSLKYYEFGAEYLLYIRDCEQIKLLIEHLLANLYILKHRRLTKAAAEGITKQYGNIINYNEGGVKGMWYHELKGDPDFLTLVHRYKAMVGREAAKVGKTKLWFGNVPFDAEIEDVRNGLTEAGFDDERIISVEFQAEKETWRHKGSGYLFVEPELAEELIAKSKGDQISVVGKAGPRLMKIALPNTAWKAGEQKETKQDNFRAKPKREF